MRLWKSSVAALALLMADAPFEGLARPFPWRPIASAQAEESAPAPGFVVPPLTGIPVSEAIENDLANELRKSKSIRPLSESECAALAARASTNGNLLEMELSLIDCQERSATAAARKRDCRKNYLKRSILSGAARSARSASAFEALQNFYALAAVEAKISILRRIVDELDAAIVESDKKEKLGLQVELTGDELRRQRSALLEEGIALQAASKRINARLAYLMDAEDSNGAGGFGPVLNWDAGYETIDLQDAISVAFSNSGEMRLLDHLAGRLDGETLGAVEAFMPSIQPLLAMSAGSGLPSTPFEFLKFLICPPKPDECVIQTRRMQLLFYRGRKQREIASQIRESAFDVEQAVRRLGFSKSDWQDRQRDLKDVEEKFGAGLITQVAVTLKKIEVLRMEDEISQRVIELYVARAKLRFAQGTMLENLEIPRWNSCF